MRTSIEDDYPTAQRPERKRPTTIVVRHDTPDIDVAPTGDRSIGVWVGDYGLIIFCSGVDGAEQFARTLLDHIEKNKDDIKSASAEMRGAT